MPNLNSRFLLWSGIVLVILGVLLHDDESLSLPLAIAGNGLFIGGAILSHGRTVDQDEA